MRALLTALHTGCSSVLITMYSCSWSWLVKHINVLLTLMVLFIAGIGLMYCNKLQLILLLSYPPCDIVSVQNQKHSLKKCKPDNITLLLKIPQWLLITSSHVYYCWSWLSCKSLCYFFDLLLIFYLISGYLPLYYLDIVGMFLPHMSHTLLPLEKNVPLRSVHDCLLIVSNSLFNSPFSMVLCN